MVGIAVVADDQIHDRQRDALAQARVELDLAAPGPQVLGILHVERELRVELTTNDVKITPVAAHTTPANTPPIKAAWNRTLVLGMYPYRNVNTAVTST